MTNRSNDKPTAFELSVMRGPICIANDTVSGSLRQAERAARDLLDLSEVATEVLIYRRRDDGVDWSKVVREVRA